MKFVATCVLCVLLSLAGVFQASAQSIVGAWTAGSTTVEGASVLVFLANGYYYQIQNALAAEAPHGFDGFERGAYTWNPATGALTITTIQDLNGDTGLSNLSGVSGVVFSISGDAATITVPGGGSVSGTRVTGASPIVGAWSLGNAAIADNSGVLVLLPNGVYFEAEDGDSSPVTGDPSGHDGMEHGTFAWDPVTGAFTSSRTPAPYVDTNGEWGLSHTGTQLTFRVSADGLTLNGTTGPAESFSLARVGAAASSATSPDLNQHGLTGSWYEPAKSGQGVEVEIFPDLVGPGVGQVQLSWFTYDASASGGPERQRWYTMGGNVSAGAASVGLPIYQNVGGNFNAGPTTSATQVGTGTLRFADCEHGSLDYTFTDGSGRSGILDLTRLTRNVTCAASGARPVNADFAFSGNWYDPATSGQGITLEINPLSPVAFFAWYTYAPSGAAAGAAGQRWYTGQSGYVAGTRTLAMKLYATTGGLFDASAPVPATVEVGTATLTFQSCTAATLDYTFSGGSSAGAAGRITLSKIGPAGPGCVM